MKRLRCGAVLSDVLSKLKVKWDCFNDLNINNNTKPACYWYNNLRFDALSAICRLLRHDITINALMIALNCESNVLGKLSEIGYGANVAFELHLINNQPYVKILYAKNYASERRAITRLVRGCTETDEYCPLSKFISAQKAFVPTDIQKECSI
ncbi:unnamed protein product [Anisakis simplex]|uniref:Uncharacterized protein n=1 Tax=Anisakis simplex TaxID=6269 RepID=A0A3P6NXB8_ANISI|nr:unnamed protein product [Anisakis simplex]